MFAGQQRARTQSRQTAHQQHVARRSFTNASPLVRETNAGTPTLGQNQITTRVTTTRSIGRVRRCSTGGKNTDGKDQDSLAHLQILWLLACNSCTWAEIKNYKRFNGQIQPAHTARALVTRRTAAYDAAFDALAWVLGVADTHGHGLR